MKIKVYKKVPNNLQKQIDQLHHLCFHADDSDQDKEKHADQFGPSNKDRIAYVLGTEDNQLVGVVVVLKRTVLLEGEKLVLGGFGGVGTLPASRRKGVASKLLKRAMLELEKANCEVAYLCTDIYNPGMVKLYGQFGFVLLAKKHTYLGKSGKRYVDKDGMIVPVKSKAKFKQILASKKPLDIGRGNW